MFKKGQKLLLINDARGDLRDRPTNGKVEYYTDRLGEIYTVENADEHMVRAFRDRTGELEGAFPWRFVPFLNQD